MNHFHKYLTALLILFYLHIVNCQLHVENVALSGTCSMTERHLNSGDCTKAIDNVTDLEFSFNGNCIHTTIDSSKGCLPSWQVILDVEYTITNITIHNREGYTQRLTFTNVTVDGTVCKSFGSNRSTIQDVNAFQCSSPIRGHVVNISRHDPNCESEGDFSLNLCEVQVWVCSKGWYGNDCNTPCSGHCSNNATCDQYDGSCPAGCIIGRYGSRCDNGCPQNCVGACNQSSGACFECMDQYYGNSCTDKCGHCAEQRPCGLTNGYCLECEPGWELPLCQFACNDSYYGQNCSYTCGHCYKGDICNKMNGHCVTCDLGWEPPLCQQECNDTYYGIDCLEECGNCSGTESCDKKNGYCSACNIGWEAPLCKTAAVKINPSHDSSEGSPVGVIVGGVVGVAVVIIAIALFILVYRRRRITHKENSNSGENSNNIIRGSKNILSAESAAIQDINQMIGKSKHNAVHLQCNHQLAYSGLDSDQSKDLTSNSPSSIVDPREIAVHQKDTTNQLYENVPIANKAIMPGDSKIPLTVMQEDLKNPVDIYDDDTDDVYNTECIYSTYRPLVVWDAFQQSILSSLASDQLSAHFKSLTKGLQFPHTEGMKSENMTKNRFKAILPYDNNRVILQRSKAEKDSDYINASYIKGYLKENAYIATQGPRALTINDFWLMIWQRTTAQIIMLTNLKENGKDKCEEYWPATGTSRIYGSLVVTCLSEDLRADFITRVFTLKLKGNSFERQVQHYHYMAWPDHGVPSATSLVDFWRYVRARAPPSFLPVVHCSAGVGRTGTYIALDIAMDLVADGRDVNVLNIVTDLREDRTDMVQTEAQYKFLYEVIFEAYMGRNSRLTREEFDKKFPLPINVTSPTAVIDNEFKILQVMGEFAPKPECSMSTKRENITKCRNTSALPGDNHLVYLNGQNQRNTFINAVWMPSFKQRNGVLLTQLPLPNTLVDFWRLVDENDVTTIVSLSYKDESKTVKNYCQYWPKSSEEALHVDQYVLKLVTSTVLGHHLTSYTVAFQGEENIRTVHILHFTNWSGEVPGDTSDVIQLVESINTYWSEIDASPFLVQCIDGAAKSGLFCVMNEIINRVTYDHVIDVFLAARHVQTLRPQAITNELQYRFCYKVAQAAKKHQGVYENT